MTESPQATRAFRQAGLLVGAGLIVEAITSQFVHPNAFVSFLALGAGLVGAGIARYLWAIMRLRGASQR